MSTITMYAHHVIHDADAMLADGRRVDATLAELDHDWVEQTYISEDLQHLLLIAEFGSSQDLVTHFEALERLGYSDTYLGKVFTVTSADVVGDVDDAARAVLAGYDFVNVLSPPPEG
jgi:hypothetical protein